VFVSGAHCVLCEGRAKFWNVAVINVVLQRHYRSLGGLLDLSYVEFFGGQNCTGTGFCPGVASVSVIPPLLCIRSCYNRGTKELKPADLLSGGQIWKKKCFCRSALKG